MIRKMLIKYCDLDEFDQKWALAAFLVWIGLWGSLLVLWVTTQALATLFMANFIFILPLIGFVLIRLSLKVHKVVDKLICKEINK